MQNANGNIEKRMMALEEKLEYQDYTIEKLNDVIFSQQRQLDKLEADLQRLRDKVIINYIDLAQRDRKAPPPEY